MTLRETKRINRIRLIGWYCLAFSWTSFIILLAMIPTIHETFF